MTYLPSGHRSRSSTRTLAPPSWMSRVAHGSGTQAPSIVPARNVSRVWAFSWGTTETSPPPAVSVARPCSFSQLRSATSWVLPSDGRGDLLALEVGRARDLGLDHEERAARGRAGDDADGLAVGLRERVDGGVGADVGDVDGVREERLDGRRPRVERGDLDVGIREELLERAVVGERHQAGRVGDVREDAEANRDRVLEGSNRSARRGRSRSRPRRRGRDGPQARMPQACSLPRSALSWRLSRCCRPRRWSPRARGWRGFVRV